MKGTVQVDEVILYLIIERPKHLIPRLAEGIVKATPPNCLQSSRSKSGFGHSQRTEVLFETSKAIPRRLLRTWHLRLSRCPFLHALQYISDIHGREKSCYCRRIKDVGHVLGKWIAKRITQEL